jgi:hypothetical protein
LQIGDNIVPFLKTKKRKKEKKTQKILIENNNKYSPNLPTKM